MEFEVTPPFLALVVPEVEEADYLSVVASHQLVPEVE